MSTDGHLHLQLLLCTISSVCLGDRDDLILQQLREKMNPEELKANNLSRIKGESSWLTTLPLKLENFLLNKREFYDAISLRYRWTPKYTYLPSLCPCGERFDVVDHAISCMKGGFIYKQHDDVRDLSANLLKEVYHDVQLSLISRP